MSLKANLRKEGGSCTSGACPAGCQPLGTRRHRGSSRGAGCPRPNTTGIHITYTHLRVRILPLMGLHPHQAARKQHQAICAVRTAARHGHTERTALSNEDGFSRKSLYF